MAKLSRIKDDLLNDKFIEQLNKIYQTPEICQKQKTRYAQLVDLYVSEFQPREQEVHFFSAPGRSEVCGNHTDHNNGKVLAAGINLDAVAIAAVTENSFTRVKSVGYDMDEIEISDLSIHSEAFGSSREIIRGMYAGFVKRGYKVGPFDAYTTSDVLSGSGLSSSAAFEVLIGTILNHLFNDGKISPVEIAQIAQFSENNYFGKPCGLMDQTASSVGGFVTIDFKDSNKPLIEKIDFDFASCGHYLCIVDTGGNHSNLTDEYGAVRKEMENVASVFDKTVLREIDGESLLDNINEIREKFGDRAFLRAVHFFEDNKRVEKEVEALKNNDFDSFKKYVIESGHSSYMYNQNVYPSFDVHNQSVSVALCIAEKTLKGKGAWRVHGGGFAGTMQAFVPDDLLDTYLTHMKKVFGENSCYVLSIRPYGGVKVI